MPKINVYDLNRKNVGEIDLSEAVFGAEVNEGLLYEVLKAQLASKRAGTASTKNRAAVAGSTRKLLKQKGSGGSRHGSISAPTYVGGGQVHGPVPRSYSYRPPRKMRSGAMRSALSLKLKEGHLTVVENFELAEVKTKNLANILAKLEVSKSAVLVDIVDNENLKLSVRNLPKHQFLPPEGVNLYDVLRFEHVVLTKKAVAALEERLKG
jgi:large subunit ribosomal protein L4